MKRILLFFLLALSAASCKVADKFEVTDTAGPAFSGLSSVHGTAAVRSSSPRDLFIDDALVQFRYKKRELAAARLMRPVEVPAGTVSAVRYDLKLEADNLSDLQTLRNRMETNPSQVSVDITARVRYGNFKKTVRLESIPYTDFFSIFEN